MLLPIHCASLGFVSQVMMCWHMCYTISCSFNKYEHTRLLELSSRPEIMATLRYLVTICCVFVSIVRGIRTGNSFFCDLVLHKENVDPKLGWDTEPNCHLHDYTDVDVVECLSLMSSHRTFSRNRPLNLVFMGDSRLRQHYMTIVNWVSSIWLVNELN